MHATIRHTFYYEDRPVLETLLETFIEKRLEPYPAYQDVSLFVPSENDPVAEMHDFPVFCVAFDILIEGDDPIAAYNDSPEFLSLHSMMTDEILGPLCLMDNIHIDIIHDTGASS